jgi:DNA invertase Pin-like site-specific DNA recombinase
MKKIGDERYLELAYSKTPKQKKRETGYAVIYTRVSSKEQTDNASLHTQKKHCEEYARKKGLEVIAYFGGTHESAKTDERKEFQQMLAYVKRSKKVSDIIVYSYSRFSRTGIGGASITSNLNKSGIYVRAVTQEVDASTPSGAFQQNIYYSFEQYDNQVRRRNMMNGMVDRLGEGYWPLTVPLGYVNLNKGQKANHHKIVVDEKGKILKRAWEWKIKYNYTNRAIVERLNKAGLKISERKLSQTFRNPFYCGKIVCSFLPNQVVEGMHETMVKPEVFFKVLDILKGRFEKSKHSAVIGQQMPLKRFVSCGECGNPTTGYLQKQKNIYYYKCRTRGCGNNINQKNLHHHFKDLLYRYQINPESAEHLKQITKYVFKLHNENIENELVDYRANLTKLNKKIERLEERFIDEEVSKELYDKHIIKFTQEKKEIEQTIKNSAIESSNLENCIDWVFAITQKLTDIWASEEYAHSETIQKVMFPDGITYDWKNKVFLTSRVNCLFLLIPQLKVVSSTKKPREINLNSFPLGKSG